MVWSAVAALPCSRVVGLTRTGVYILYARNERRVGGEFLFLTLKRGVDLGKRGVGVATAEGTLSFSRDSRETIVFHP